MAGAAPSLPSNICTTPRSSPATATSLQDRVGSIFGQANDFLNEQLGSPLGRKRVHPRPKASGFQLAGHHRGWRLSVRSPGLRPAGCDELPPGTSTVPTLGGTTIPILQIIDPQTGQLRAYNPGSISTGAFNASGGDGIFSGNALCLTLIPESTRVAASAGLDYELDQYHHSVCRCEVCLCRNQYISGVPADDLSCPATTHSSRQRFRRSLPRLGHLVGVALDNVASDTGRGTDIERSTFRASGGLRWEAPNSNVNFEATYTRGRTR